jgi:hypothetical protein
MKKSLIIIVSLILTALNINSYGDLSERQIKQAKSSAKTSTEITLEESSKMSIGSAFIKVIYVAELMCFAEIGRKNLVKPLTV